MLASAPPTQMYQNQPPPYPAVYNNQPQSVNNFNPNLQQQPTNNYYPNQQQVQQGMMIQAQPIVVIQPQPHRMFALSKSPVSLTW